MPVIQTRATIIAVARPNSTRLVAKRTAGATTAVARLTATRATMSRTRGAGCAGATAATGVSWINVTLVPVPGPPARMSSYAEEDGAGARASRESPARPGYVRGSHAVSGSPQTGRDGCQPFDERGRSSSMTQQRPEHEHSGPAGPVV